MADGVDITPGTGKTIATDDLTADGTVGGHVQLVKLIDGTDGGNTRSVVNTRGLTVDPRPNTSSIQVASTGLTIASTPYTSGDATGAEMVFASAVRASGGYGSVIGANLVDKAAVIGAFEVYLFDRSVTPAANNAVADFSDADMLFCQGVLELSTVKSFTSNRFVYATNVPVPYKCNATSLYVYLVTKTANAVYGATTDLVLTLLVQAD